MLVVFNLLHTGTLCYLYTLENNLICYNDILLVKLNVGCVMFDAYSFRQFYARSSFMLNLSCIVESRTQRYWVYKVHAYPNHK